MPGHASYLCIVDHKRCQSIRLHGPLGQTFRFGIQALDASVELPKAEQFSLQLTHTLRRSSCSNCEAHYKQDIGPYLDHPQNRKDSSFFCKLRAEQQASIQ